MQAKNKACSQNTACKQTDGLHSTPQDHAGKSASPALLCLRTEWICWSTSYSSTIPA